MEPLRRGQLKENVTSASVYFHDTFEKKSLEIKSNSYCHFFEPFEIADEIIQLRLDWSDLDENKHPTLDADFYNKETKKLKLTKEKKQAHHTSAENSQGRIYKWEYRDTKRKFTVEVFFSVSITESIRLQDEYTAIVIAAE